MACWWSARNIHWKPGWSNSSTARIDQRKRRADEGAPQLNRKAAYLTDASLASSPLASMAPGMREPSAKKIVGVPVMRIFMPSALILSLGVVQASGATAAALPLSIHSSQALLRSAEHQTFLDLTAESGERML